MSESKAKANSKVQYLTNALETSATQLGVVRQLYKDLNAEFIKQQQRLQTSETVAANAVQAAEKHRVEKMVAEYNLDDAIVKQAERKAKLEQELDDMHLEYQRKQRFDEDTIERLRGHLTTAYAAISFGVIIAAVGFAYRYM